MATDRRSLFAACILGLLLAGPLHAAETATVIGTIQDESGALVPGATITARQALTGFTRTTTSAADGSYRIPALPPGPYQLSVEMGGFAPIKRDGVKLNIGAEANLNFTLKLSGLSEALVITADAPVVETTNASVQTIVARDQIDILPIIGRDYQDLARLSAGAVVTNGQGTSFTGSRGRSNSFVIDGVDNSEDISGFRRQQFNLDAVEEFQVLVNNFKAEYGRASGGVIAVLSRSGTNEFHGNAFFLYRDQDMVARNPFVAPGSAADPFERKQWGGALGGPIVKNRTHFFTTFDYEDRATNSTITAPYPAPGAAVSAATRDFLTRNGVPAFPDTSLGTQVRLVRPEYVKYPKFTARVDHQVNSAHNLTFRFNWERERDPSGIGGNIYDANGATSVSRTAYFNASHKWIRGGNGDQLNELYVQYGTSDLDFFVSKPELTNVFIDEFSTATPYLGGPTNFPQGRTDKVLQVIESFTLHRPNAWKGSHVFKFGADMKLFRSESFFDSNFRGTFFFRTVADFLAGRPRRFTQNQGDSNLDRPNSIFGFYVQDDWTVSRKLTLNVGLRFDYENGSTEALKDVPDGSAACALTRTCGEAGAGISGDKNNLAPRFGFIWDLNGDGKTAIHGGAGIYYDQIILNVQGNARFTPPKIIGVQIENPTFPNPFLGGTAATLRPNISVIDPDLVTPRNLNASIGVRRQLTTNVGLDATFVYNRGDDHVVIINTNAINPATGQRPNANFTNVSFYTNEGEIRYKGLLLEVRKRMADNYSWGFSYTLASAKNTSETIFTGIQVPSDVRRSFGPSDEDRLHTLVGNFVAKLPWNFQVGGVFEFRSERPLDVFAGGRDLNGDGITGDWLPGYSRNSQRELSLEEANRLRSALALAPITAYADNPKFWNLDVTLQKQIGLGGVRNLRLTLEVFNVLNHPNFSVPSGSITSSLFGQRTSIDTNRGARPRSFQLTGQVNF